MSKKSEKTPQNNSTDSRKDRLSAALKSNMVKRKAQARQRAHAKAHDRSQQGVTRKD
tara:strand:+ start:252 stop:422 length:171 start_codon:yes stop_codon:yes gene_type:complete